MIPLAHDPQKLLIAIAVFSTLHYYRSGLIFSQELKTEIGVITCPFLLWPAREGSHKCVTISVLAIIMICKSLQVSRLGKITKRNI